MLLSTYVEWPKHFAVKWRPDCFAVIVYSAEHVEPVQELVADGTVPLLAAVVASQLLRDLDAVFLAF